LFHHQPELGGTVGQKQRRFITVGYGIILSSLDHGHKNNI
jgi:hypothetical protein